jgi:hypothetical protein
MIAILHNLSAGSNPTSSPNTASMKEGDGSADGGGSRSNSSSSGGAAMGEESNAPPFSVFLPAYLILSEFCKEVASTLLVVHQSLAMQDMNLAPNGDGEDDAQEPMPVQVEVLKPSPGNVLEKGVRVPEVLNI